MLHCPSCGQLMSKKLGGFDVCSTVEYECSCGAELTLPATAEELQLPQLFPSETSSERPEPTEWR